MYWPRLAASRWALWESFRTPEGARFCAELLRRTRADLRVGLGVRAESGRVVLTRVWP